MGVFDRITEVFQYSYESAEMIGQSRIVLAQLEAEIRELKQNDPEKFASLSREQYLVYVQSRLQKSVPYLTNTRRLQNLQEAKEVYNSLKY